MRPLDSLAGRAEATHKLTWLLFSGVHFNSKRQYLFLSKQKRLILKEEGEAYLLKVRTL